MGSGGHEGAAVRSTGERGGWESSWKVTLAQIGEEVFGGGLLCGDVSEPEEAG